MGINPTSQVRLQELMKAENHGATFEGAMQELE